MDHATVSTLDRLLRQIRISRPGQGQPSASAAFKLAYSNVCKIVFDEEAYLSLWDEPALLELERLFQIRPPAPELFGRQVEEIRQRAADARQVNDLFFQILNVQAPAEKVCEALQVVSRTEPSLLGRLKSSDCLKRIRETEGRPSEKIESFLQFLRDDFGFDVTTRESVMGCLDAIKAREGVGVVNALLVREDGDDALMIPLQVQVQSGSGQVLPAILCRDDFKAAVERARLALLKRRFITDSSNVVYTLDLTSSLYLGTSIGLAAAVGMYGATRGKVIDVYTAFTGDINLDKDSWRVKGVTGVAEKLAAARRSGCRRVFVSRENLRDVESNDQNGLQIILVDDLIEVLLHLESQPRPLPGDSPQIRKLNALLAFCQDKGWDLSEPRHIENGVQFRVAPFELPEFPINLYNSGAHTPKTHDRQEYRELLQVLEKVGEPALPIRKLEERFTVKDPALRAVIGNALEQLQPSEKREEPYCEYSFRFDRGPEQVLVKQYTSGTLQIQGRGGELYKNILGAIVPQYNLHNPNAGLSVEAMLHEGEADVKNTARGHGLVEVHDVPLPYIGTDESGKGDYFGSMVIVAVLIDAATKSKLEVLGVKDSKLLSDKRCRELAGRIREICRNKYEEVEIPPERYNELYESFRREKKNLNHLLAWGHARAIESLLERHSCMSAVADQFGDEAYIRSRLMEKGRQLELVQTPKAERYVAVAAASVLARDRFLVRLDRLCQEYGIAFPKGASAAVVSVGKEIVARKGPQELRKVAKLHHKTTRKIVDTSDRPGQKPLAG